MLDRSSRRVGLTQGHLEQVVVEAMHIVAVEAVGMVEELAPMDVAVVQATALE
jgi:hypothetical protein